MFSPLSLFKVSNSPFLLLKVLLNFRVVLFNHISNRLIFFWANKLMFISNNIHIFVLSLFNLTGNCKFDVSILTNDVVACKVLHFFVNGSESINNFNEVGLFTLDVLNPTEHALASITEIFRGPKNFLCFLLNFNFRFVYIKDCLIHFYLN